MDGTYYVGTKNSSLDYDDVSNDGTGEKQQFNCMRWDGINRHPLIDIKVRPKDFNHNFCRNPDKDANGPWCYKQNWKPKYHVTSGYPLNSNYFYCKDIPICDHFVSIQDCSVVDWTPKFESTVSINTTPKQIFSTLEKTTKQTTTAVQTRILKKISKSGKACKDSNKFKNLYLHFYKMYMNVDSKIKILEQNEKTLRKLITEYQNQIAALHLRISELSVKHEMVLETGSDFEIKTEYPILMADSEFEE